MDDKQFDDIIKKKTEDFEGPSFDPSALAALHHQLDTVSVFPWYSVYRTELLVASGLMLSTLIILWSVWFTNSNTSTVVEKQLLTLQAQQAQISKLTTEIEYLKNIKADTSRTAQTQQLPSSYIISLLLRIKELEAIHQYRTSDLTRQANQESYQFTSLTGMTTENKYFQPYTSTVNAAHDKSIFYKRLTPRLEEKESLRATPDSTVMSSLNSQTLSAKKLRAIENHYQRGIGIRVGPAFEISKGFYKEGKGVPGTGVGVLADFILTPSWSIELGLKTMRRTYEIKEANRP